MSERDLTPEESDMVRKFRVNKAEQEHKKRVQERDARPAAELTREELIDRCERMELEKYVTRAESRINYRNQSGWWEWSREEDIDLLRAAYAKLGREMPTSDW